jgi:SAM-dependent methyltransferase
VDRAARRAEFLVVESVVFFLARAITPGIGVSSSSGIGRTYFDVRRPLHPNPGLPRDFLDGEVAISEYRDLLADPATRALIEQDEMPIPATADRENYYGDRHLEYWLSGLQDARKLSSWLPAPDVAARYLDFGGATGRVARHMVRRLGLEVWLCDINVNWIAWIDQFFAMPIAAFQNRTVPSLPIADGYFDLVSAFSVFTHLDHDEVPWLLELRRIVRPGGCIYATVLDEHVWHRLKDPQWEWLLKCLSAGQHDALLRERCKQPMTERVVLEYSSAEAYNANVFLPREYLTKKWGVFFRTIDFLEDQHNYQTVAVLRCP